MLTERKYLAAMAVMVTLFLVGVMTTNWWVDPYGIFRATADKRYGLETHKHMRLHKAQVLHRLRPDTLVLGTSRAGRGISPNHPALNDGVGYNLAFQGSCIHEMMRYFQHVRAAHVPKRTVMSLDLLSFPVRWKPNPEFRDERLRVFEDGRPNANYNWEYLHDRFVSLISYSAVVSSLKTINGTRPLVLDKGHWGYGPVDKPLNHRKLFRDSEKRFLGNNVQRLAQDHRFDHHGRAPKVFQYYRTIIRDAYESGIDLRMFVSPIHARRLEVFRQAGLWDSYEAMKRHLVTINEEEARLAGRPPFPLWDFGTYNSITTEPVPLADTRAVMVGYYDSSHYKRRLGDMVLDRLFDHHDPQRKIPADFGVLLTRANVERALARDREMQGRFAESFPDAVAEICGFVDAVRR